jgi:tripeptidyl-peptidase I
MTRWVVGLILSCMTISCNAGVIAESIDIDRPLTGFTGRTSGAEEVHNTHVFKESMPLFASRTDLIRKARPDDDYIHEVIFAVKMNNMDELTRMLHDISDPDSPNYGQHLKKEEVHDFISNPEACTEVTSYLHASGATTVSESLGCEYITAKGPIAVWEKMFKTDFFIFQQTHSNGETHEVVRAEHYSVPNEIHDYVEAAMNTIEMPMLTHKKSKKVECDEISDESRRLTGGVLVDGLITPARLRAYYNMSDSHGSSLSTQAVYANGGNYYSPSDLAVFQRDISQQTLQPAFGKYNRSLDPSFDNTEGNLDLQYMMAMSPGSPTRYLHQHASIGVWVSNLADTVNIPWVLSVSYGAYEDTTSAQEMNTFTRAAIRMGIMGVTIVVASGDYGAGDTHYDRKTCRYGPFFPASSPYVISVGATKVINYIDRYLISCIFWEICRLSAFWLLMPSSFGL